MIFSAYYGNFKMYHNAALSMLLLKASQHIVLNRTNETINANDLNFSLIESVGYFQKLIEVSRVLACLGRFRSEFYQINKMLKSKDFASCGQHIETRDQ